MREQGSVNNSSIRLDTRPHGHGHGRSSSVNVSPMNVGSAAHQGAVAAAAGAAVVAGLPSARAGDGGNGLRASPVVPGLEANGGGSSATVDGGGGGDGSGGGGAQGSPGGGRGSAPINGSGLSIAAGSDAPPPLIRSPTGAAADYRRMNQMSAMGAGEVAHQAQLARKEERRMEFVRDLEEQVKQKRLRKEREKAEQRKRELEEVGAACTRVCSRVAGLASRGLIVRVWLGGAYERVPV